MLPENDADLRQQLPGHALFHRIQPELGFMTEDGFNEHLDTLEGRVWIQLEWRALRRAVESSGSDRAEAIADALAFRRERRRLIFPMGSVSTASGIDSGRQHHCARAQPDGQRYQH